MGLPAHLLLVGVGACQGELKMKSSTGVLLFGSFAFSAILLYFASVVVASVCARVGERLRFMKNFGESGLEELGMPSGTSGCSPQMLCLSIQHP